MQEAKVDLILQLGDFCVPAPRNQPFLDASNRLDGPRFHVFGNHDMDGRNRIHCRFTRPTI